MSAIECIDTTKIFYESIDKRKNGSGSHSSWLKWKKEKKKITAVDNFNIQVPKGEILGVIGQNGSGKSTLIRMLSTLILPDKGQLRIFGNDVVQQPLTVRKMINRVSVDAAFFKKLSAWENLSYAARLYGVNVNLAKKRAIQILEGMSFKSERMYDSLENLSRGMQQKVAIARALFTSPVLLLLDEPTTGLDPVSKRQVQDYVIRIRETHDATVLITSHDMMEVDRICDRVAIMDNGKIVACDTPENLKQQYSNNGKPATFEDVFFKITGKDLQTDADKD